MERISYDKIKFIDISWKLRKLFIKVKVYGKFDGEFDGRSRDEWGLLMIIIVFNLRILLYF